MKPRIDVVGAVIVGDGGVLCAQRGPDGKLPGLWEFPGGKVEPGESPREALIREISEELDCVIDVGDEITTTAYEYDFGVVTLTTFFCSLTGGEPQSREHAAVRWMDPSALRSVAWAPADIPAVEKIQDANRLKPESGWSDDCRA